MLIGVQCSICAACVDSNEEMIRFPCWSCADLNPVSKSASCTPLQKAVQRRNLSLVKLLLELGAGINGKPGEHGSTIHYALQSNDASIIRSCLDNGVEIVDCKGWNSLCEALMIGMKDIVPELLTKGAEINQKQWRQSALGYAFEKKNEDTAQFLLQHGASLAEVGPDVFLRAVRKRLVEDIKRLLDGWMDPTVIQCTKQP